ncbi:MAG TPA: F420H2 dehydrogenase subunit FpoO, partial [Methanothrix sp.]|nr:F420H2 dehydrogenase subunit FpoO [Methanothrix sp.]
ISKLSALGDELKMADCELCTRARPTLFPIKAPVHNLSYPEGAYKGVCDICLENMEKAWQERFGPKTEAKK